MRINKKSLPLLLVALALLLIAWHFNLFSVAQSMYGGLTAISIQKDEVISDNPFFSEPVYHIVAVVHPNSQEIRGETDLSGVPLKLTVTGTSETKCMYKISNQSTKIWFWEALSSYGRGSCGVPCCNIAGCSCTVSQYGCDFSCVWSRISTQQISMPYLDSYGCYSQTRQPSNILAGEIYYIEPVPFYKYNITINFNVGGVNVPIHLTSDNTAGYIQDFAYAQLLGSFQGQQGCPALYTDAMVWRNPNSANMFLIWKYNGQEAIATQNKLSPKQDWGSSADESNKIITYARDHPYQPYGFQCKLYNISPTETSILCDAVGEVAYPVVDMYIKASILQQYIPSGKPQIVNVSCPKVEAVDRTQCKITVKNTANQKDTFEIGLQGFRDVTPFSVRQEIGAGETKTVEVPYSGSGIIGQYKVFVYSVNNPQNRDEQTVKIVIEPFCDRPKIGCSEAVKVMTEKGCFWYCGDKYYNTEIGEYSGIEIEKKLKNVGMPFCTDPFGDPKNCSVGDVADDFKDFGETYHCVEKGKRATIYSYLSDRYNKKINAYIPKDRRQEHLYFIPAFYDTYHCTYLAEYGYHYNPLTDKVEEILGNEEFNYNDMITGGGFAGKEEGPKQPSPLPFIQDLSDAIQNFASGTTTIPLLGSVSNSVLLGIVGGFLILGLIAGAPTILKFMKGIKL